MRDVLLDILNHTHDLTGFEFLKIYHTKEVVKKIIPDRFGKITQIHNTTNQLQTTKADVPWLEVGMPVRFSVRRDDSTLDSTYTVGVDGSTIPLDNAYLGNDGSTLLGGDSSSIFADSTGLDQTATYYVTSIQGEDSCIKFTVGETNAPEDVLNLPASQVEFYIVNDRSYFQVSDTSKFKVGDPVLFEHLVDSSTAVIEADLNTNQRYFINEIIDDTKLRVSKTKTGDFIHYPYLQNFSFELVIDKTFIEAVSEDEVVYVLAETKQKITDFNGEFGIEELDKLYAILDNTDEYFVNPNDSALSLPGDQNLQLKVSYDTPTVLNCPNCNEFISTKLKFKNADGKFTDEFVFIDKTKIPPLHKMRIFTNTLWNFSFVPNQLSIQRFDDMAKTYNDLLYFDAYTKESTFRNTDYPALPHYNLNLKFGEDNPTFGNVVFEENIHGTYVPQVIYKYKTYIKKVIADYRGIVTRTVHEDIFVIKKTNSANKSFVTEDTSVLNLNEPIKFYNPSDSSTALIEDGFDSTKTYYVKDILSCSEFTVSDTVGGDVLTIPFTNYEFFAGVKVNRFEMTFSPPDNDDSTNLDTTYQDQKYWLKKDMAVKFLPLDDSVNALLQVGIDYNKTYYVKEIFNSIQTDDSALSPTISRFSVSESINGTVFDILDSDTGMQFICYHEVNELEVDDTRYFDVGDPVKFKGLEDSSTVPLEIDLDPEKLFYIKEIVSPTRFTISSSAGGEEYTLPKLAIIDFMFMVIRENNNGILFTSYPTSDNDLTDNLIINNHTGYKYPIIPADTRHTYTFGTSDPIPNIDEQGNVQQNNTTSNISAAEAERIAECPPDPCVDSTDSTTTTNTNTTTSTEVVNTEKELGLPKEPSFFAPLKVGDKLDDSTDKLYTDVTIPIQRDVNGVTDLDGKFVYAFEYETSLLQENFLADSQGNGVGDEVKIYEEASNGYRMPVGFLRNNHKFYVPHTLAILSLPDTKEMRFSDQGKLMITLDNDIATYNYIIIAKN